ncbi:MAG: hypothetical protein WCP57_13010 [Bacteroidota bacterium]
MKSLKMLGFASLVTLSSLAVQANTVKVDHTPHHSKSMSTTSKESPAKKQAPTKMAKASSKK